jgi:hypothetical protein
MYWDVKAVKPLPDFRIYVEIEDGRKGIFDMNPYLDRGVFRELRDVHRASALGWNKLNWHALQRKVVNLQQLTTTTCKH